VARGRKLPFPAGAMAQFTIDKGVQEAIVDLTNKKVESTKISIKKRW